jgi:hypothetical protein
MTFHTGQTFTFGEQPSATKWGYLWENDEYHYALLQLLSTGFKLLDTSGNEIVIGTSIASAVNEVTVRNAATANAPKIAATGGDTNINLNLQGKGTGSVQVNGTDVLQGYNYVVSGIVITADSVGVNKNYSISSGVVCIGGNFLTVAAVSAQTVGASKDRYIDLRDNGDGTAAYITNEVANNSASQALTAGDLRIGIVVAGATTIATTGSINQGDPTCVLPIASSIAYTVTDSLGNLICPTTPYPAIIGYRQLVSNFAPGTTAETNITGLSVPIIVPAGRKVKLTFCGQIYNTGGGDHIRTQLKEGATVLQTSFVRTTVANDPCLHINEIIKSPTTGLHTYVIGIAGSVANPALEAGATEPAFLKAELV